MTHMPERSVTKPLGDSLYTRCDCLLSEQIPDTFWHFHKRNSDNNRHTFYNFIYEFDDAVKDFTV